MTSIRLHQAESVHQQEHERSATGLRPQLCILAVFSNPVCRNAAAHFIMGLVGNRSTVFSFGASPSSPSVSRICAARLWLLDDKNVDFFFQMRHNHISIVSGGGLIIHAVISIPFRFTSNILNSGTKSYLSDIDSGMVAAGLSVSETADLLGCSAEGNALLMSE